MTQSSAITPPVATRKRTSKIDAGPSKRAPLTGKAKRHLRALGHALEPVLHVGKTGISEALVGELEHALRAHELVKVRLLRECPVERDEAALQLAARSGAEHVQTVGSVLLLYREHPEKPGIELPGAPKAAAKPAVSSKSKPQIRRRAKVSAGRAKPRVHSAESGLKTKRARLAKPIESRASAARPRLKRA